MKPVMQLISPLIIIAICIAIIGCGTFGNGKIDLPYDVAISLELPDGTVLVAEVDEQGTHIEGSYMSPATGIIYDVDENGTITATDHLGNQIKLTPRKG